MASPRALSTYPAAWFTLLHNALQAPVELELTTKAEAMRLRRRIYAFRDALLDDPSVDPRLSLAATEIRFRIEGRTLRVYVDHSDIAITRATVGG